MDPVEIFKKEVEQNIEGLGRDTDLQAKSVQWIEDIAPHKYAYNYRWMGRPIIQFPQDMVAMQELIWEVRPDLIIEAGIAHGGSIIFYASMLELLEVSGLSKGEVLGVDIDIRAHNRAAIEAHPMFKRIRMIEGSSIAPEVVAQVQALAAEKERVMVVLDSNHTHDDVLAELEAYAPLTSVDSYCVVFDTIIDDMPEEMFSDRPWGRGNNPKTAVREYLKTHPEFESDKSIQHKLLITVAPDGYLRRMR